MNRIVAIRGAVQAEADTPEAIDAATRALLREIVERNDLEPAAIAAAWFTQTSDLRAVYPAASARRMGWDAVPMLCAQEAGVDAALERTIRALVLVVAGATRDPCHVYLGEAEGLRPDLIDPEGGSGR